MTRPAYIKLVEHQDDFIERNYSKYAPTIFRKCLRFRANRQWAEDITHDVFIKLMEKQHELDPNSNIGAWLNKVAYNLCLDKLRREATIWNKVKLTVREVWKGKKVPMPDNISFARRDLNQVMTLLDKMPPKVRMVFTMKHLDNLSQQEIAQTLGLSKGFVSKLLKRATRFLESAGWETEHA